MLGGPTQFLMNKLLRILQTLGILRSLNMTTIKIGNLPVVISPKWCGEAVVNLDLEQGELETCWWDVPCIIPREMLWDSLKITFYDLK